MINSFQNPCEWDYSLETTFRDNFAEDITKNIPEGQTSQYLDFFLDIYDNCSHMESAFSDSIALYMDADDASLALKNMCFNALEFYETYKHHFISNALRVRLFRQHLEMTQISYEAKVIKLEIKSPLSFNEPQRQIINDLIDLSVCAIDFEPLINAVTLSCGHSINLAPALDIHKNINDQGNCEEVNPCSNCRLDVISFKSNVLLRKVASKIEEIARSFEDQNSSFLVQQKMVKELTNLLMCNKTARLLTSAISSPRMGLNVDAITSISTPDYTMREIARLVDKLNELFLT